MNDLWNECYDPRMEMAPAAFEQTFCRVCAQLGCSRSAAQKLGWVNRMRTQADRLLVNPKFADRNDPKYAALREIDFPSALQEAMRLEISDRRNDWSIPTPEDAQMLAAEMATRKVPPQLPPAPQAPPPPVEDDDEPIGRVLKKYDIQGAEAIYKVTLVERVVGRPEWLCTCKAFEFGRARPCKHIEYARTLPDDDPDVGPEPTPPAPVPPPRPAPVPSRFQAGEPPAQKAPPPAPQQPPRAAQPPAPQQPQPPRTNPGKAFFPAQPNIPLPSGGVMVDGSAPPPPRERPNARPAPTEPDPWAPPPKAPTTIPVGGRVVMGGNNPSGGKK